jgi:tetratricopeptide (TPR) repeat protein
MIINSERQWKRQLRAAEGYLSLGMHDHALDALDQVSSSSDAAIHCLVLRGDVLRAKLDHHQALDCFRQAHELDPDNLEALMGMAWCFKRIDCLDQSIEAMRLAYQSHPKVSVVLYNLACYYSLARNKEQALSWLGRALRMDRSIGKLISAETDFDPLRDDPDFRHLLELSADG